MTMNMGLTLIPYLLFLKAVCCITSQEHMSSEDINDILDRLIKQTKSNETTPNPNIMDTYLPTIDTQPGNDSNIYYFKTYMAPQVKYKNNNELIHLTRRLNKTIQGRDAGNNEDEIFDTEPYLGTNKLLRNSYLDYDSPKRLYPRMMYGRQGPYTEYEADNFDDKYLLDNLIKKEMVAEQNAVEDDKQLAFAQQAGQNEELNLLHDYPEIIIDHVTYDDDKNDKEVNKNRLIKIKATHDRRIQNLVKGEKNSKFITPQKPILKTRYAIPEEEIQIIDRSQTVPMEQFAPINYLPSEMQGLIESIIQKKIVHDTLLKQTSENESRKQNMLLEKILQKIPDKNQLNINVKSSYHHERMSPLEIEKLSKLRSSLESIHRNIGHHLSKPYMKSLVRNKWELRNHLLGSLRRLSKSEAVKRSHHVVSLIDKIMAKMDYQPVYYDVYRK